MNSQMIKKLIIRDYIVYRKWILGTSLTGLIMGMFFIFVNSQLDRMFAGASSIIIITVVLPFIPELQSKGFRVNTASLPVTRKAMVVSRYLISLIIVTVNLMLWVAIYYGLMFLLNRDVIYLIGPGLIIIVWMILLFNLALFYFAYYRFSFFVAMGFYLFSMVFPQIFKTLLKQFNGFVIEDINQSVVMAIISVLLFVLSFFYSILHFQKKDL